MRVAVIPARGGSKRIPRKNIRSFFGQPMIGWSIIAAKDSGCFDKVIVSTDDAEIASVAREYGADVPFVRPAELADDHTPTLPVICHAIEWCSEALSRPEFVCCVYATAPFLRAPDLTGAFRQLQSSTADYVFSATDFGFPIQRAIRLRDEGRVEMLYPEHNETRSQDLEDAYHDAGQFYWGRVDAWRSQIPVIGPASEMYFLPRYRVQDIDTMEDWRRAEALFQVLQKQ